MTRVPSAYVSAYLQLTRISNFETSSHLRAHSMRKNSQILYGDQIRCEANIYTVEHEC